MGIHSSRIEIRRRYRQSPELVEWQTHQRRGRYESSHPIGSPTHIKDCQPTAQHRSEQSEDNREETDTPGQQAQQNEEQDHEGLVQAAMAELPEDLLAILLKRAEKSRQRQSKSGACW